MAGGGQQGPGVVTGPTAAMTDEEREIKDRELLSKTRSSRAGLVTGLHRLTHPAEAGAGKGKGGEGGDGGGAPSPDEDRRSATQIAEEDATKAAEQ